MPVNAVMSPSRLDVITVSLLMMSAFTQEVAFIVSIIASLLTIVVAISRIKLIVKKNYEGSFLRYLKSMSNFKGFWKK